MNTALDYRTQAEYCRDRAEVCRINGSPDADRWTFEADLYETWAREAEAIEAARIALRTAPTIPPGWRTFANKSAFEEYERELLERTKADMKREGISWEYKPEAPANPAFCCKTCGRGFDFGCRCPDY